MFQSNEGLTCKACLLSAYRFAACASKEEIFQTIPLTGSSNRVSLTSKELGLAVAGTVRLVLRPPGHPFLLRVSSGERAASIFRRLQVKLVVPECELRMWNLLLVDEDMRTPLEEACADAFATLNSFDWWY